MNTAFADISHIASNLISKDAASFDSFSKLTSGRNDAQTFESKFQKEVSRLEKASDTMAGKAHAIHADDRIQAAKSKLEQDIPEVKNESGRQFISSLEQALLKVSGGSLENISMDSNGLDTLQMLLVNAGFDANEVADLIAGLKEKVQSGSLTMKEVLAGLGELDIEVEDPAAIEAVYLETSALPFLTTLLHELGIDKDTVSLILDQADNGQNGISLDVIMEQLRQVQTQAASQGVSLSFDDSSESFKNLMAQMNMPLEKSADSKVSLNDLLQAFESYKLRQKPELAGADQRFDRAAVTASKSKETTTRLINDLFSSFSVKAGSSINTAEFSYQQIKEQFANDLMLPGKGNGGKAELFAQNMVNSQNPANAQTLFTEVETLLAKTAETVANGKAATTFAEQITKESKSETLKSDALFQGAASSAKSEASTLGPGLSARSTARTLPAFVTQQVGKGIVRAINNGETSLKLQLKPAELGRITMTIDNLGSSIKVSIITENHAARDVLASNVNELKSALGTAGISLDSFDVDMNSDFKQSMANAGNQSGQFGGKNSNRNQGGLQGSGAQGAEQIAEDEMEGISSTTSSLHFVA